jgi:hypothetical protein
MNCTIVTFFFNLGKLEENEKRMQIDRYKEDAEKMVRF